LFGFHFFPCGKFLDGKKLERRLNSLAVWCDGKKCDEGLILLLGFGIREKLLGLNLGLTDFFVILWKIFDGKFQLNSSKYLRLFHVELTII
jgi:hypothetical protein